MDCRSGVYSEVQRRAHEQTVITKSLSLSLWVPNHSPIFSALFNNALSLTHMCVRVCVRAVDFCCFPNNFP
jgi:hypothetical protein